MDTENYTAYLHLYNWTGGERHASESNCWCWQVTGNVLCVTMQLWPTVCPPACTVEYVQNIQTFSAKVEESRLCLHAQRSKSLPFLSSEKPLGLGPCATVQSRRRQIGFCWPALKTPRRLWTTQQLLIHMFTHIYVSVFLPRESCKSLSYLWVPAGSKVNATNSLHQEQKSRRPNVPPIDAVFVRPFPL